MTPRLLIQRRRAGYYAGSLTCDARGCRVTVEAQDDSRAVVRARLAGAAAALGVELPPESLPPSPGRLLAALGRRAQARPVAPVGDVPPGTVMLEVL